MTPQTDTTATPSASAIRRRLEGPRRRWSGSNVAFPAILRWPSLVWLLGSIPGVLAAISGWPSGGGEMTAGYLNVGVICFAATIASLLPIRNLASGPPEALPLGLLATLAIRGSTTLCLLIAAISVGWIERSSVALPIVLWYMAFLVTDLVVVNRLLSDALPISVGRHSERTTC